LGCSGGGSG
jgi:hypothetical protein